MTVFSFGCRSLHIKAFSGFRMSPLSLQVKVNTEDPTHGAAVSGLDETPPPGQPGTPGVNGRGAGGLGCAPQPPLLDVVLSGSPLYFLPSLSFSTTPYCSTASLLVSLSFSLSHGPSLHSIQGPFPMPSEHKQASINTHPDTETQLRRKTQ